MLQSWQLRYDFLRSDLRQLRDKLLLKLARALPARLTYCCAIVVIANATSGDRGNVNIQDLNPMDTLKAWEEDHAIH